MNEQLWLKWGLGEENKDNFIVEVLFCLQGGAAEHIVELVCLV